MNKFYFLTILSLFFQISFCQEANLLNKIDLENIEETSNQFHFRLSFYGTKIDVFNDSLNKNKGLVTKFIFQEKDNKIIDTIYKKYNLSQQKLFLINSLIDSSKIETIPNQNEILNWKNGFDGITYVIEINKNKKYSKKAYWTPKAQDSTLLEVKKISQFLEKIEAIIKLDSIDKKFNDLLPNDFSYWSGGSLMFYKVKNTNSYLFTDFYGTYRLPLGIKSGYYVNKINKTSIKLNSSISFQKGFNENYSLKTTISKYSIFSKNKYFDGVHFNYEKNKLNYISENPDFELKSIIYYGGFDKILNFGLGYTNLSPLDNKNGFQISLSKDLNSNDGFSNNITISPYMNFNIYKSITNYELGIETSYRIKLNKNHYTRFYTTLFLEKIYSYNSLNVSIYIPLKTFNIN